MGFMKSLALAASTIISFTSAAPTFMARQDPWVLGTQNNTQEFYMTLKATTYSLEKYNGWACTAIRLLLYDIELTLLKCRHGIQVRAWPIPCL
jgi:hypothetical protein